MDEKVTDEGVKNIEEKLADFNAAVATPDDVVEEIIDEADETETPEETTPEVEEEDQAEETEEEEDSTLEDDDDAETEVDEEAVKDDANEEAGEIPTLPDAYLRAAIHQGMSKEEVFDMFDSNPEASITMLSNIYKASNNLSSKWAQAGQVQLKQEEDQKEADTKALNKVDVKSLEEEYGADDPLVTAIRLQAEQMDKLVAKTAAAPKQSSNEQAEDVKVLNTFFSNSNMEPYGTFYGEGKDWNNLTRIQETNRWSVVEQADCILAGSKAEGQAIPVEEALDRAHIIVSEPVRATAIRDKIKKKIVKRSKSRSLAGSAGKNKNAKDDKRSLEDKVEEKLRLL